MKFEDFDKFMEDPQRAKSSLVINFGHSWFLKNIPWQKWSIYWIGFTGELYAYNSSTNKCIVLEKIKEQKLVRKRMKNWDTQYRAAAVLEDWFPNIKKILKNKNINKKE